jgi:hypothetical protein
MSGTRTPASPRCQHRRSSPSPIALGFVLLLAATPGARSEPAAHGNYLGAFAGVEVKTGLSVLGIDPFQGRDVSPRVLPMLAVSARVANLMSLLDVDLGVGLAGGTLDGPDGALDVLHTRLGIEARVHPFFMSHLQGTWVRAGLHLALGVGADLLSTAPGGTKAAFALSWGFGMDVPLSDMQSADPSVWLGVGYRMRFVGFDGAPRGLGDRDGHDVFVALSVRWHGVDFARIPRPPELHDRDPE